MVNSSLDHQSVEKQIEDLKQFKLNYNNQLIEKVLANSHDV